MARQGRAGAALGIAAFGSFIAGVLVTAALFVVGPALADFALAFGPAEYTALLRDAGFARVDIVDPNTSVGNNKVTRIIAGASYQLSPNVRLLADLDRQSFESGATDINQVLFQAQFVF